MTETRLFEVALEMDAAGHAPPRYAQATAYCAVWARDAAEAERLARGDRRPGDPPLLPLPARVRAVDAQGWDAHITAHWPGLRAHLPDERAMQALREQPVASPVRMAFFPHD